MSPKTNEVAVETVISFAPVNEVPKEAPPMQLDITNPMLSYDDVLPSNYFSMEDLQIWLEERDVLARVLRVTGCTMEYVYDPEKGEETGEWKPCLHFADTATLLVINRTRGQQLKRIAKSPYLKDWATIGEIAIKPGIGNGKAQIIIEYAPDADPDWAKDAVEAESKPVKSDIENMPLDELNEELFG